MVNERTHSVSDVLVEEEGRCCARKACDSGLPEMETKSLISIVMYVPIAEDCPNLGGKFKKSWNGPQISEMGPRPHSNDSGGPKVIISPTEDKLNSDSVFIRPSKNQAF